MSALPANPPGARTARAPVHAAPHHVLVVDGDPVTRRFIELALTGERRVRVETAASADAAFELLRTVPCDLLITEARLPDLDGLELVRRVRGRGRTGELPIVVLSADERVDTKVGAFAAGADDYLVKPCAAEELRARVMRRLAGAARAVPAGAPLLGGVLAALPLPDLVGALAMARRTATVELRTRRGEGALFFEDGRLVHATYLTVTGPEAFYQIFAEADGWFQLHDGCAAIERTVDDSVTGLIMEAARRLDTARADHAPAPARTVATAPPPVTGRRVAPTTELARGFTHDVTDPYVLAELELMTMEEVAAWSARTTLGPRLQIAVLAPAALGVTAIASIATAPSERELIAALDRDPRCLVARLRGREGRELDLVLIELVSGDLFARALGRRPELALVAPPAADRPSERARLGALLPLLAPAAVQSIGPGSRAVTLEPLVPAWSGYGHLDGDLARPGELRRALAEALQLWRGGSR